MLMNRATARRPISSGDVGGFPGQFPPASPAQPEASATVAPPMPAPSPSPASGGITQMGDDDPSMFDPGLPMPPLPPPPPGSNLPLALPGGGEPGGRSMFGAAPGGMDLFGGSGGPGGEGAPDEDLLRRILAGLPRGR